MRLLTAAASNTKTAKNAKYSKYLSYILHLAPSNISGFNVCPKASKGCKLACLNTAGRGVFNSVQAGRIRKTKMLFTQPNEFMYQLMRDLSAVERKAKKLGVKAVVRLNGTSDLDWLNIHLNRGLNSVFYRSPILEFPNIQFYDYTKVISRLEALRPSNYHLTFSRAENNAVDCLKALRLGVNVAVVFKTVPIDVFQVDAKILDGDSHDLRFLDKSNESGLGSIIALTAKGKAKRDTTGFTYENQ